MTDRYLVSVFEAGNGDRIINDGTARKLLDARTEMRRIAEQYSSNGFRLLSYGRNIRRLESVDGQTCVTITIWEVRSP